LCRNINPVPIADLRCVFASVKPPRYADAMRREGYEVFVVCKGFKGERA
jgi:hypothetical protein